MTSWPWVGPKRATTCMFQPRLLLIEHLAAPVLVVWSLGGGASERADGRADVLASEWAASERASERARGVERYFGS